MVLEKEQKRKERAVRRAHRRSQQREKDQLAAIRRMQDSIELMKKCIVVITTIRVLGVVTAIWTLFALNTEVEKIQAEIEKAQPQIERIIGEVAIVVDEVERVRESLKNPMQSIGSAFGKELDMKLQSFMNSRINLAD